MSNISPVISVRVDSRERSLLETAAGQARTSLSDFIRRKAIEAAEIDLLDNTKITIAAADWEKFESWVAAPPKTVPALKTLAVTRPVWRD